MKGFYGSAGPEIIVEMRPYYAKDNSARQGIDIFVDGEWIGSRRTLNQVARYVNFWNAGGGLRPTKSVKHEN